MTRRTILRYFVLIALIIVGVVGTHLWVRWPSNPLPPNLPDALTDPAARKLVQEKRQRVLTEPTHGEAWGTLGMAFEAHEAGTEAVACYRQAMALSPDDPRWPYLLANQLYRTGGAPEEEVIRLYRLATDLDPPTPTHRTVARLTLAELLTEIGRGDEAGPLIESAYSAEPYHPWAAYRMGILLFNRGDTDRAAEILISLLRNPLTRKKATIAMAELSRRVNRLKDAESFDTAAALVPPDARWPNPFTAPIADLRRGRRALMDRFVAQEAARDERSAVHTATALADQYPSIETQMVLLKALVNVGDYPAALAVAEDILREPEGQRLMTAHSFLGLARLGMADLADAKGHKAECEKYLVLAVEALGKSVQIKPDYAPGHVYRAKALLRLGQLEEAEKSARAAIASRPEEWEGYLTLADVLSDAGRKADAVAAAELAVKLAPPNETTPKQTLEALKLGSKPSRR